MIKKIVLLIMIITFTSSCDYSPVHSNKENNIEINIINISGDAEINNYLLRELKRKSKSSSEKINVQINTSFSKRTGSMIRSRTAKREKPITPMKTVSLSRESVRSLISLSKLGAWPRSIFDDFIFSS